jgi:hypothetical protein
MPLVFVAVTVSYVASARLAPRPAPPAGTAETTGATVPSSRAPVTDESRSGQQQAGPAGR